MNAFYLDKEKLCNFQACIPFAKARNGQTVIRYQLYNEKTVTICELIWMKVNRYLPGRYRMLMLWILNNCWLLFSVCVCVCIRRRLVALLLLKVSFGNNPFFSPSVPLRPSCPVLVLAPLVLLAFVLLALKKKLLANECLRYFWLYHYCWPTSIGLLEIFIELFSDICVLVSASE